MVNLYISGLIAFPNTRYRPRSKATGIAVGASLATLFGGLLLGFGGFWVFRIARRKGEPRPFMALKDDGHSTVSKDSSSRPPSEIPERSTSLTSSNEWDPRARPTHYTSTRKTSLSSNTTASSIYDMDRGSRLPVGTTIIHHYDGGRARAGIQQPEVVEFPPEYRNRSMYSDFQSTKQQEGHHIQPTKDDSQPGTPKSCAL